MVRINDFINTIGLNFFRSLRRGKHRLLLWPGVEADGSAESTTPSKQLERDEMGRLEKVRPVALQ